MHPLSRPFPRAARILLAAISLATAASAARSADLSFDPAVAKAPPMPRSTSVEFLAKPTAAGNAILRAQFDKLRDKRQLVIQGVKGPTLLRDDGIAPDDKAGDGQFAAVVQVNTEAFTREQRRRIELARDITQVPLFGFRELLGFVPFRPSNVDILKPGIVTKLDDFRGVPFKIDAARELLIRDTAVVENLARTYDACSGHGTPMGAWTFGRLMTEMANPPITGIDASDFVEHWISQWKSDLTINGLPVPNRAVGAQALLDQWPKLANGKIDLAQAPFRLLAIVNRQDLRGNLAYGGSGNAGEARLVFGLLDCQFTPGEHFPLGQVQQMTVIFEYGIAKSGCTSVRDWAAQWTALGTMVLGSPPYNVALQAITDQFTLRNANPSRLPNRSAINQVRTNEFALAVPPIESMWELRESKIVSTGANPGFLEHSVTAQTPDRTLKDSARLRDYVNDKVADILAGTHQVPLSYPPIGGTAFLGAHPEPGGSAFWRAPGIIDLEARHRFSLATCDACHTAETRTKFVHVKPRAAGAQSDLSDFLTGANMPVVDPVSHVNRNFHDLLDRQMKLDATAHLTCFNPADFALEELNFRPLPPAFRH
jgi:hypothetical protein